MQKEGHMTSAYAVLKLLANVILQCAVCIFTFLCTYRTLGNTKSKESVTFNPFYSVFTVVL